MRRGVVALVVVLVVVLVVGACSQDTVEETTTTGAPTTTTTAPPFTGILFLVPDDCDGCDDLVETLTDLAQGEVPIQVVAAPEGDQRPAVQVVADGTVVTEWKGIESSVHPGDRATADNAQAMIWAACGALGSCSEDMVSTTTTVAPTTTTTALLGEGCYLGGGRYVPPGHVGDFGTEVVGGTTETICVQFLRVLPFWEPGYEDLGYSYLLDLVVRRTEEWGDERLRFAFAQPGPNGTWPAAFTTANTHPEFATGPFSTVLAGDITMDRQLSEFLDEGRYYFLEIRTSSAPMPEYRCPEELVSCAWYFRGEERNARLLDALKNGTHIAWDDISTWAYFVYAGVNPLP